MPASRPANRRSVVPDGAGRSLWLSAVWTGAGAVIASAVLSVAIVAICWLPVSGQDGRTNSAIRAGLLTFLASLHGGITVDGTHSWWLPLGMLIAVGLICWRAGAGLADAAGALGESDPVRLAVAAGAQTATFTIGCAVLVPFSALGTSTAPFFGVLVAAPVWFALTGGLALVRTSPLRAAIAERAPARLGRAARAATAALAVYLASGAVLVLCSLVVHHGSVDLIAHQVGGGWGGIPILLLGILAAPNAAISAAAYLTGPGFAVGAGTHVGPLTATHGTLPAFPLLGAIPSGDGATPVVLALVAVTACGAGLALGRLVLRTAGWTARLADLGAALALVAFFGLLLGWQAGGAIGDQGLAAVGPSPWQFGLALAVLTGGAAAAVLGLAAAAQLARSQQPDRERMSFEGIEDAEELDEFADVEEFADVDEDHDADENHEDHEDDVAVPVDEPNPDDADHRDELAG